MATREELARQALHAAVEESARRPGRGALSVRVLVEDSEDGRVVTTETKSGRYVVDRKEERR